MADGHSTRALDEGSAPAEAQVESKAADRRISHYDTITVLELSFRQVAGNSLRTVAS